MSKKDMQLKPRSEIVFLDQAQCEMIKVSADGFWVRGVKVEQGPGEAGEVYKAFKSFVGLGEHHSNEGE